MPWDLTRGLAGPVFGQGRILHARQERLDLEKKELNLVVLAILRASRYLPNDTSVSGEVVRASIKYH